MEVVLDRSPGGEVTNLFFNYFEGSNQIIIGRESEMRGSLVKCGERPLEGFEKCLKPFENYKAMDLFSGFYGLNRSGKSD